MKSERVHVKRACFFGDYTPGRLVGYTIIKADSMDAALSIAKSCHFLDIGGALEVSELIQMPGKKMTIASPPGKCRSYLVQHLPSGEVKRFSLLWKNSLLRRIFDTPGSQIKNCPVHIILFVLLYSQHKTK
ncbi:hypothetical protein JXQ31_00045 [candidate division KSB1 bacterium]|nr:hypothetical protein [candidate division KSB1 bacterium]